MNLQQAILLLGPTGSGKTPLGQILESRGLCGRPCTHFDFGEELRRVARLAQASRNFSWDNILLAREVLSSGRLLENDEFFLALRILDSFLEPKRKRLLVMNGLPRHMGQAKDVAGLVDIVAVVCLVCIEATVLQRVQSNVGGDRAGRSDDDADSIRTRFHRYNNRTEPLLSHYHLMGVRTEMIVVTQDTHAEEMWEELQHLGGWRWQNG